MQIQKLYKNHKKAILMIVGIMIASLIALPYVFLGEGSYVEVHDQLDGEVLNYIYRAKYLFTSGTIKEFMNGADPSAMMPPAPMGVLIYKVFAPFTAFAIMHEIELIVAFLGMYYLLLEWKCRTELAFAGGILFTYLPFYPVYGLSAYGQPFLLLAFIWLLKGNKMKPIIMLLAVAGFSSFSLIGYAFVGTGYLAAFVYFVLKRRKEAGTVAFGSTILLLGYVAGNFDLLQSMISKDFVSHRTEMTLTPITGLFGKMTELLFVGGAYSKVYSTVVLAGAVLLVIVKLAVAMIGRNNKSVRLGELNAETLASIKRNDTILGMLFGILVLGSFLAAMWNGQLLVSLRETIGGPLPYFQADRIYWTFPFLWLLIFIITLEEILLVVQGFGRSKGGKNNLTTITVLFLVLMQWALLFRDNSINKNLRLLFLKDYQQITWESIYMDDVFAEIEKDLEPQKDNYSVVSLGLYPSVPLYHGYTCADGYSNNYDLKYKHIFREIVAKELDKNEYSKWYFDEWGNRLYLFAEPYGINGSVGKSAEQTYLNPEWSLQSMADMNIKYIFAAAAIEFTPETNSADGYELRPVREEPYESKTSYYRIWVYELVELPVKAADGER